MGRGSERLGFVSRVPEQWREASGDAAMTEQLRLIESNLLRYRMDDFWGVLE